MIKTIEVGFPGGKRVDAIIDDRLIKGKKGDGSLLNLTEPTGIKISK